MKLSEYDSTGTLVNTPYMESLCEKIDTLTEIRDLDIRGVQKTMFEMVFEIACLRNIISSADSVDREFSEMIQQEV